MRPNRPRIFSEAQDGLSDSERAVLLKGLEQFVANLRGADWKSTRRQ